PAPSPFSTVKGTPGSANHSWRSVSSSPMCSLITTPIMSCSTGSAPKTSTAAASDSNPTNATMLRAIRPRRLRCRRTLPSPSGRREKRHSGEAAHRIEDCIDSETEILEQGFGRRGGAETVDADDMAVEADVFAPEVGDAGLDRNALAQRRRQYAVA